MATKTNDVKLSIAVESSTLGTLPGTPDFYEMDRVSIDKWGAIVNTESVQPINQNAMDEDGIVTGVDSGFGFSNNLTISGMKICDQGTFRANRLEQAGAVPTSILASDDSFNHAALSAAVPEGRLIYARDLDNTSNDGLHVVDAASTTTKTITTSTLADQSSIPANARFNVVGVQGTSGDIEMDSDNNITSTTLDFTTLSLNVGQALYIGGGTTGTTFANTDYVGLVRVKLVETNKITIDERPWTVGAADTGTGKTIQLFFGDFIRNVLRTDSDYNAESYTAEGEFPDMESSTTNYEYPNGNRVNTCTISFPQRTKATIAYDFVGLNTPAGSSSQTSGNRYSLYDNRAFGTSSDCVQLKLKDSSKVDYTTTFTNFDITIDNAINPETALCTEYAVDLNDGNFMVSGNITAFMNDLDMINAVRTNGTVTIDYAVENTDGVVDFYIPNAKLSGKDYEFQDNGNVLVSCSYRGSRDAFYNFVMGVTYFHYLPI